MATTPANESKRKTIDWEAVERDYRAGMLSIRELAKLHDISDKAVRNKAKELGWERDLTEKIAEKAKADLVRAESAPADLETERTIIDTAAASIVTVVRGHRKRITRQTQLVDILTEQLVEAAVNRSDVEEAIEEETANDQTGQRKAMMLRSVSLQSHSAIAVNLANALKTLVGLERQAFNIKDEGAAPTENPLAALMGQISGKTLRPVAKVDDSE